MSALPDTPLVTAEQYLNMSFPDGDREFVDGVIVERNVGTPGHSTLQMILVLRLGAFQEKLGIRLLPECRTKISEARYRVPDVAVMVRPFKRSGRIVTDAPFLVIEILSPEDRLQDVLTRFRDYDALGVKHIVLMDPVDTTAFAFENGSLVRREFTAFDIPERGSLPFDSADFFRELDRDLNEDGAL